MSAGARTTNSIWSGRSWVVTLKHLFDGVIYALLTAANIRLVMAKIAVTLLGFEHRFRQTAWRSFTRATFGWLWPKSL